MEPGSVAAEAEAGPGAGPGAAAEVAAEEAFATDAAAVRPAGEDLVGGVLAEPLPTEPEVEAIEEPEAEPEPEPPAPDPRILGDAALAAAEAATARHDAAAALAGCLEAARIFEEAGLVVAALDACREALAISPGDIDTHLRYASICRARGWREVAQVRLVNVLRLAELDEDAEGRARIRAVVEASFADDEELMRLSA